ncbi:CHAT domain-containing protein [Microbacteriaceae bacterium VKM Ac-2855]|nr:CHAT domain-containing protein [Microbacteriaceae bacterium VKM Ac-2855]
MNGAFGALIALIGAALVGSIIIAFQRSRRSGGSSTPPAADHGGPESTPPPARPGAVIPPDRTAPPLSAPPRDHAPNPWGDVPGPWGGGPRPGERDGWDAPQPRPTSAPRGDDALAPRGDDAPAPRGDDALAPRGDDAPVGRGDPESQPTSPASTRTAYPLVDAPYEVAINATFTLEVGLTDYQHFDEQVGTGGIELPETATLEIVLVWDLDSFEIPSGNRYTLDFDATEAEPKPLEISVTAKPSNGRPVRYRRIAVHYFFDNRLVGIVFKEFVVAERPSVLGERRPEQTTTLLDLAPLIDADRPDLIVAIYRTDGKDDGSFAWAAFSADPGLPVPGIDRSSLHGTGAEFGAAVRRQAESAAPAFERYTNLGGFAHEISSAIPPGILALLTRLSAPHPGPAATVLLLTDEADVPWELAEVVPLGGTGFGGASPFLGAHVAIGRWPIAKRNEYSTPRGLVEVTNGAVITADYTGTRMDRLVQAEAEATALTAAYTGTIQPIPPYYDDVVACIRGTVDWLHVALHGKFSQNVGEGGLIVLQSGQDGVATTTTLSDVALRRLRTDPRTPFVFLNACQVGANETVLGDYGGMSASFLSIGASAVVAPMWKIDDVVAHDYATAFYPAAYGGESVGEILRRRRAEYVVEPGGADAPHPTLLAYILSGHPRLTLTHASSPAPLAPTP